MDEEIKLEGNAEIADALKQLDVESPAVPQAPTQTVATPSEVPKIVQLLMRVSGNTLSQKQAEYTLLGFVVIFLAVSFYLFFGGSFGSSSDSVGDNHMLLLHPELMNK